MPKSKSTSKRKPHVLWPRLVRSESGHVTTDAEAVCEKANELLRVDDLRAEFVVFLGDGLFVDAETHALRPAADVCRHCVRGLARRISAAAEAA